jgi:glycogen synthase
MVARLASEKEWNILPRLPAVLEKHPQARVLYVGQYQNVWGEAGYYNHLKPILERLGDRWKFLGIVSPVELSAFFKLCDVITVPSLNSTESFSIVQIESMVCGTPVVASNLAGVRQPVEMTGWDKSFRRQMQMPGAGLDRCAGRSGKYQEILRRLLAVCLEYYGSVRSPVSKVDEDGWIRISCGYI